MISIITLTFVIGFSMLVTKIASIALVHTGMSKERAQFQARSAFTGAGFTTTESEVVVKHPIRRRIITILIVVGNAGLVTAVSSLILGFVGTESAVGKASHTLLLFACIGLLFLAARSKRLDRILTKLISKLLDRYANIRTQSFSRLMTLMGDYEVTEVEVSEAQWLEGKTLAELKLKDEGVLVIGIIKANGSYLGVPRGHYSLELEDKAVVYGKSDNIAAITSRKADAEGEESHQEGIAAHKEEIQEEDAELAASEKR